MCIYYVYIMYICTSQENTEISSPRQPHGVLSVWIHTLLRLLSSQELLGEAMDPKLRLAVEIDPSIRSEMRGRKIQKALWIHVDSCGFTWIHVDSRGFWTMMISMMLLIPQASVISVSMSNTCCSKKLPEKTLH